MNKMSSKIIIALDADDGFINQLPHISPELCRLKIGKTLFTQYGPHLVHRLQKQGFDVFLDLKFHDIPQQVAGACLQAAHMGVWMLNVHALGGLKMLRAAKAALASSSQRPLLIGVTLLTSLNEQDLKELGLEGSCQQVVMRLATLCYQAGLDGVVCSPLEVKSLKQTFGSDFICVTPGVRLDHVLHDQERVMTPEAAIQAGSDYLVIGRPITQATSPEQVLKQIQERI